MTALTDVVGTPLTDITALANPEAGRPLKYNPVCIELLDHIPSTKHAEHR